MLEGDDIYEEYEWAKTNREAKKLYDESQDEYAMSQNFQYAFLGLYIFNVVDAYLVGNRKRQKIMKAQSDNSVEFRLVESSRGSGNPMVVYSRRF